ncbi:hypothetical protein [Acidianus manzaensis]|uniref:Uncharacterized protein n=1 Tax=Acidianus manzaensis TaxID=282676 RepID=A0A1W6K0V1_9CREN|nr:hypothetical protein [Acidianus manzaensis]ARM76064.1 hypothetical protein B6F84_08545 [Acidianus manzaensis]
MEYTDEITLRINKSELISILAEPYLLAGITGHLALLKVYDQETNTFVPPLQAKKPLNEYLASLVFQDEKGNVKSFIGKWKGPDIFPNSITYEGNSNDEKVTLKIMFNLSTLPNGIRVGVHSEFNIKLGLFDKLFKSSYGDFASHIVKCHIIPYLESIKTTKQDIKLVKLDSKEVDIDEAIKVLRDVPKITGILSIKGNDFTFKSYINNGQLTDMLLIEGEKSYANSEALGKLITKKGSIKMEIYELPITDLLKAHLDA